MYKILIYMYVNLLFFLDAVLQLYQFETISNIQQSYRIQIIFLIKSKFQYIIKLPM